MIDVITVVFQQELSLLEAQAESINYYAKDIINDITVIVNDHVAVCDQVDVDWWGKHRHKVKILHRDFFLDHWPKNGWLSQQALKLAAADRSASKYSLILDAKNILVANLPFDLVNKDRIYTGIHPIKPVFQPSADICSRLFSFPVTVQAGTSGTPFLMINAVVKNLIDHVGRDSFIAWFLEQGLLTEFVLYSSYIDSKLGGLDRFYAPGNMLSVVNICHSDRIDDIDTKLQNMHDHEIISVAVHRNAWINFTETQKNRYRDFLVSRSITKGRLL